MSKFISFKEYISLSAGVLFILFTLTTSVGYSAGEGGGASSGGSSTGGGGKGSGGGGTANGGTQSGDTQAAAATAAANPVTTAPANPQTRTWDQLTDAEKLERVQRATLSPGVF